VNDSSSISSGAITSRIFSLFSGFGLDAFPGSIKRNVGDGCIAFMAMGLKKDDNPGART
jgi:hypothetical protein